MPRPRVISAKNRPIAHVELTDGDWINLKRKLNYGEASDLYDATYRSSVGGTDTMTAREVRMSTFNIQRIMIYTLAWSFIDDENKPVPITADTIRQLDQSTTTEIHKAITDLENEVAREEEAGNAPAATASSNGSQGSSATSQASTSPAVENASS